MLRFLLVGGANTLLTYAIFFALGLIIAPWLAYAIAFALGLVWVVFGSSRLVFSSALSLKRGVLFALWYLVIFGIGQLAILIIEPEGAADLAVTSVVMLLITTPLNFIGGRFIFRKREPVQG